MRRVGGAAVHHDDRRAFLRNPPEGIRVRARDGNAKAVTGSYDDRHRHELERDLGGLTRCERAAIFAFEGVIWSEHAVRGLVGRDSSMECTQLAPRQVPHVAIRCHFLEVNQESAVRVRRSDVQRDDWLSRDFHILREWLARVREQAPPGPQA